MKRSLITLLFALCSVMIARAQFDTNFVQIYKNRLVVSIFQSYRYQNLYLTQNAAADTTGASKINYKCSSKLVQGFAFDWDKISFALSWKTPIDENTEKRQGKSSARNLSVGLNTKKSRYEASYRYYQGFFDENIANIPAFNDSTPYFQNNDLSVRTFKLKHIYFRNKKKRFSYKAAYSNTHRQLKSAATWVFISNLYYQRIQSNEDIVPSIVPVDYYQSYRDIHTISSVGLSLHPGVSVNLVAFKRIFVNGTLAWGPQIMYRRLRNDDDSRDIREFKFQISSGDARFSIGYNGENFLIYSWFNGDFDVMDFPDMDIARQFISGGVSIGYRFKLKEKRNWTQKVRENKWYQKI
ncbi:MAG: DUF4421 family protein [Flavobacteriales bacterium]